MANWYKVQASYERLLENGCSKKEPHYILIDALNYTEAEARAITELTPFASQNLEINKIIPCNFADVVDGKGMDQDKWYKVKCFFIALDEKTQAEKTTLATFLIQAKDFQDAVNSFVNYMHDSMAEWEIGAISETPIEEVYRYQAEEES